MQQQGGFRINRSKPIVTYGLIGLLVAIFIVDKLSYFLFPYLGHGILSFFGMKIGQLMTQNGEWWRLLTANFLHADIFHIGANALGLYIWGRYIESFYGRGKYAGILLLSGLCCVAASYAFTVNPSLGASGMVFGLYGALLGIRKYDKRMFNAVFGVQILVYIGISVFLGFRGSGVDNFGHIGGLVGGFLASRIMGLYGEEMPATQRVLFGLGYVLFFAICIYIGYAGMPF